MKATCLAAFAGTLFALVASAANPTNGYQQIPRRNVFNLQPIPTAPQVEPPPRFKPQPPRIFITGLVDIGGVSKALVEITEPGQPVHRHIFAAGSGWDTLEILQVDVQAGRVRLRLDGAEETLQLREPKPVVAPVGPPPLPIVPVGPPRLAREVRG